MEKSGSYNNVFLKKNIEEIDQKKTKFGDFLNNILNMQGKLIYIKISFINKIYLKLFKKLK